MKQTMINYIKKEKFDELYTPKYAVSPLIKYLDSKKTFWECTDFGESNITKILKENNFKVINTKKSEIDFLKDEPPFHYDVIITNPPYSLKNHFLKKCYLSKKSFALLLPLTSLEGVERAKLYRQYGLELLVLDRRINYTSKKSCWFNTSWFCQGILPKPLIFETIKRSEEI